MQRPPGARRRGVAQRLEVEPEVAFAGLHPVSWPWRSNTSTRLVEHQHHRAVARLAGAHRLLGVAALGRWPARPSRRRRACAAASRSGAQPQLRLALAAGVLAAEQLAAPGQHLGDAARGPLGIPAEVGGIAAGPRGSSLLMPRLRRRRGGPAAGSTKPRQAALTLTITPSASSTAMWSGTESPTACTSSTARELLSWRRRSVTSRTGPARRAAAELRAAGAQLHPQQAAVEPAVLELVAALGSGRRRRAARSAASPAAGTRARRSPRWAARRSPPAHAEQRRQRRIAEHDAAVLRDEHAVGHGGQQRAHRRLALLQRRFATLAPR